MDDWNKLNHLLGHWVEHNRSHGEGYKKWIGFAESTGRQDIAGEIQAALECSSEMNRHFEKAMDLLRGEADV